MAVTQVLTRQEFYQKYPAFASLAWGSAAREKWLAEHSGAAAQWSAIRAVEQKMASTYGENWRNTAGEQWYRVASDYLSGGFGNTPTPGAVGAAAPTAVAPAPAPAPAVPGRDTSGDASAKAIITGTLAQYGLGSLGEWAWQQFLNGVPTSQIFLDLKKRPEYVARFPGMAELAQRGQAISEAEYINLESTYRSVLRSYGIPTNFYDGPEDFGRYIAQGKSPQELEAQLDKYEQVAANDPRGQALREMIANYYGVRGLDAPANMQGILTAWFIDPEKTEMLVDRQFRALTTGVAAQRSGFGAINVAEAEEIAGYGTTEDDAVRTFGQLATMDEFLVDLPGGGDDNVERGDLLQAGFAGNAQAQQRIERTRRRRQAQFQGGGGYAAGQAGVSGLGSANR